MTPTEIRNAVCALQAQGHSLREISRSLALSRNTVRRILRQPNRTADEAAPCDEATLARLKTAFARARGNVVRVQELLAERAALWLASTHAANTAKEAAELMFSAGGSASPYTSSGLERCVRDIHAAAQHILVAAPNYQMVGQAFLGADMRATPLLSLDDRSGG